MYSWRYVCTHKKISMTKKLLLFSILLSSCFFFSCDEKMTEDEVSRIGIESCRKPAAFISKLGFDPTKSAFSSTDVKSKGIVLIQLPSSPTDTIYKKYQDSSWAQYGHMGPITTDENGNAYTSAIPFVNTLDNTFETLQRIYCINSQTGKMEIFTSLPKKDSVAGSVPFGILGLYYDCHGKVLYASSVSGSTNAEENGEIYCIDISTGKVLDSYKGLDAMGLFVGGFTGTKKLYFGHARSSEIFSIELDKKGSFKEKAAVELSLDGLGPRGLDKARRIRSDKFGNLTIYGIDFAFNLAAQSDKPETFYQFGYNKVDKKWILMKVE